MRSREIVALAAVVLTLRGTRASTCPLPSDLDPPLTSDLRPLTSDTAQDEPGAITGVVLESRDGAAVAKVLVRIQNTDRTATTDESGRFAFDEVAAGTLDLYVSVVDFILVKRPVTVRPGETADVTILLSEGTVMLTQSVTVTGHAGENPDRAAPSSQTLKSTDIQQLRGLVTNDPLRAIQVLPGVAASDDLKSEFTVRGNAVDHILFTFEGIATPLLVHTVQRIVDTGSVAMINGDILGEVSLAGGAYPERYGNRLGAELDFWMREGSRERTQGHVSVSGTDSALVTEGPIGHAGAARGSWLTSIRKSYLDLITSRLDTPIDFTFGFTDAQAKAVYDVTASDQLQASFAAGRSRLNLDPADIEADDPKDARNASAVGIVAWRHMFSPRSVLTDRVAIALNDYRNTTMTGVVIARGASRDLIYRPEWTFSSSPHLAWMAGGEWRASTASRSDVAVVSATRIDPREHFDDDAVAGSAFVQATAIGARWRVTPGARIDHWTLTNDTAASPWVQASYDVTRGLTVRGGASIARQQPTFDQVVGLRGTPSLGNETADHAELGVEWRLASEWRIRITGYDREEHHVIRLPNAEYHLVPPLVVVPSLTTHYANALEGTARGVDVTLQRQAVNGLSGWVAYTYGTSKYHDTLTGESFWGDYDQRHTLNAYGLYRFNEKFSASGRMRAGSNFPTVGYWQERDGGYFVASTRNDVRVPPYARLDLRVNRTFVKRRTRMTLFVEVLNALNRYNVRAAVPSVDRRTGAVRNLYDQLFPRVPSAGVLVEF